MEKPMAFFADRLNIQPMLRRVSAMVMVMFCLLAASCTNPRTYAWKLSSCNGVINGSFGGNSIRMISAILTGGVKMFMTISVHLDNEEANVFTSPPPENKECLFLQADNLGSGCSDVVVIIGHQESNNIYADFEEDRCICGFTCDEDKIREIIQALQLLLKSRKPEA